MNWNHTLRASVAIVAVCASVSAQAAAGVSVSISSDKKSLGKNEDVVVSVTMTNHSSATQYVLKWYTPFGEIEESLFDITRDGKAVAYQGAHYKRPAPGPGDYYKLKPGASHTVRVELSSMYDMSITGDYTIRYKAASLNLFTRDLEARGMVLTERSVGELKSQAVSLWIDGRQARGSESIAAKPAPPVQDGPLAFNRCTASQQSEVTTAIGAATSMANNSDAYMAAAGNQPGARYVKWFGAADASRVTTVKANFAKIKEAFASKPITVDCGCKKTYYAYVYPNQPYKIYVCKAFWTAPMTGTDSKGGTLVHEMSHFTAVAGTDDWVYGQAGAASLAITDPAKAINNADSHEYFSENTPAL